MSHYYRIRAFVDGGREEEICLGRTLQDAMTAFLAAEDRDTEDPFGAYSIDVAMVHRISFGETCPVFEDVTAELGAEWARASYEKTLSWYSPAPAPTDYAMKHQQTAH